MQSLLDIEALDNELRPILEDVGHKGMEVHEIRLEDADAQLKKNIMSLQTFVQQATDIQNVNSLAQIKKYLEDQGYPTKSVAQEVLRSFEGTVPYVAEILKLRKYTKMQSYLRNFAAAIDMDGRIHYEYRMDHQTTGRLYMTDYNLQQLPPVGRHCIIPDNDKFVVFDFKQFDLRVLAADSGDPDLVGILQGGYDPYIATAASLFDVPYQQVDTSQRNVAKVINLAVCYGGDTRTVTNQLGVTSDKAKEILTWYYETYPLLRAWTEEVKKEALSNGYAENRFGRVMKFSPEDDDKKRERQAVAMRGQGGSADIIRQRLVELHKSEVPFVMTVHDSIMIDVKDDTTQVAKALDVLRQPLEVLNGPLAGQFIPLDVTVKEGPSWGLAAHEQELREDYYGIRWL